MMRQAAPAQQDRFGAEKAIFANLYRLGRLPSSRQIDAVSDELGAEARHRGESADPHPRGAIDEMAAADSRMPFQNQFRPPLWLVREMPAGTRRKSGDPIQLPDDGVRAEMKQIGTFANREMPDARLFLHDEVPRKNPGKADMARGMDRIAELMREKAPAQSPGKQDRQEHRDVFQHVGASER